MTKQRINISNIVRSILLIAIGIVIGVGIGISIGRVGNAPAPVSQRVGRLGLQAVVRVDGARLVAASVPGARAVRVEPLKVAALDCVVAQVVTVGFDEVRGDSLLV